VVFGFNEYYVKVESYTPIQVIPSEHSKKQFFSIVSALFKQYFYIAFLMGKPQDLPSGNSQMQIGLLLAFATYVLAWSGSLGWGGAALLGLLEILGTGLILVVALQLAGKLARFQQAFGGLYGASTFINLAGWPVYVARFSAEGQVSVAQGNSDVITHC